MSVYEQEIGFAAGTLIATPLNTGGVVTPVKFGILQDVSVDMSVDLKELYGQNRFAVALAPGKTKFEVKAKFAAINGALFNNLFFGGVQTAAQILFADSEQHSIPSTGAYTVVGTNASVFAADEGVFYEATGLPLQAATVLSAAGQYEVSNTGTYTFDSADASGVVLLNYLYTSSVGSSISITNNKMGVGPSFSIMLNQPFDGRQMTLILNTCQASKLSLPTKQDDYMIPEIDFMVASNSAGIIGSLNTSL